MRSPRPRCKAEHYYSQGVPAWYSCGILNRESLCMRRFALKDATFLCACTCDYRAASRTGRRQEHAGERRNLLVYAPPASARSRNTHSRFRRLICQPVLQPLHGDQGLGIHNLPLLQRRPVIGICCIMLSKGSRSTLLPSDILFISASSAVMFNNRKGMYEYSTAA
jgi:hypothetical protein